jgi:hypothetical protein
LAAENMNAGRSVDPVAPGEIDTVGRPAADRSST